MPGLPGILIQKKICNFPLFEEKEIYNTKVKLNCWPPGKKGEKVENMYNYKIVVTDSDIKYLIQKDESLKKGIEDVLRIIDEESYVSCSGEQQFYRGCVTEFRYGDGYIRLISEPWMDTVAYCHQSLRDKISDLQQELFSE